MISLIRTMITEFLVAIVYDMLIEISKLHSPNSFSTYMFTLAVDKLVQCCRLISINLKTESCQL